MRATPTVAMLALAGLLIGITPALAADDSPPAPAPAPGETAGTVSAGQVVRAPASPPPAPAAGLVPPVTVDSASSSPGLAMTQPSHAAEPTDKSLVKQWWFWSILGAVVVGTVLTMVLVDRGPASPNTNLGNREFRP